MRCYAMTSCKDRETVRVDGAMTSKFPTNTMMMMKIDSDTTQDTKRARASVAIATQSKFIIHRIRCTTMQRHIFSAGSPAIDAN